MWQVRKPGRSSPKDAVEPKTTGERRLLPVGDAGAFNQRDQRTDLKVEVHQRLLGLINLNALDQMSREQIES